jgi:hypothetical protein
MSTDSAANTRTRSITLIVLGIRKISLWQELLSHARHPSLQSQKHARTRKRDIGTPHTELNRKATPN